MQVASCLLLFAMGGFSPTGALDPLSSAEFCGRCHRAILDAWKTSAHARSMDSAVFQLGLESAEADFGAAAAKTCIACHSPIAVQTGDLRLKQKVSWEGVTCEYCHSMREVSFAGPNPKARVEFSLVKSGPIKDAGAPVHGMAYSPVHTTSDACAPCHEYRNTLGLAVLTTYSEWKQSRFAREGIQCQHCHMGKVVGDVVDPKIRKSSMAKVNLHQMPGSHSIDQLNKTIKARMAATREGDQLKVTVEVANVAAGHFVPTGSPMRQLILEVRADSSDGKHYREERAYRRVVAGPGGTAVVREPLAFLRGAKQVSDTRLAPDERRIETLTFPVPVGVPVDLKATLWYYYSPLAATESQKRVTFLTLQRFVK